MAVCMGLTWPARVWLALCGWCTRGWWSFTLEFIERPHGDTDIHARWHEHVQTTQICKWTHEPRCSWTAGVPAKDPRSGREPERLEPSWNRTHDLLDKGGEPLTGVDHCTTVLQSSLLKPAVQKNVCGAHDLHALHAQFACVTWFESLLTCQQPHSLNYFMIYDWDYAFEHNKSVRHTLSLHTYIMRRKMMRALCMLCSICVMQKEKERRQQEFWKKAQMREELRSLLPFASWGTLWS